MKAVVKAILSFMITSWTYSETMLIFPEIQPFTEKVIQVLTIPTHDEWRVYNDLEYQAKVTEEINSFLVSTGLTADAYSADDYKNLLSIPTNLTIEPRSKNLVSLFDNKIMPESLYESF